MAWDPCVSCNAVYRGKAQQTYVTWFDGDDRYSYRLRQCPACAASCRNPILEVGDVRNSDGDWERSDLVVAAISKPSSPRAVA